MRLKSLSSRLFVVTAVALLPALAIAVSNIVTVQRDRIADLHTDALRSAELVGLEVDQTLSGLESVLRTVAAAPVVRSSDAFGCSALLTHAASAVGFIADLYILNVDGSLRCSSVSATRLDQVDQDVVSHAKTAEKLVTGSFHKTADGVSHLPIALRIGGTKDGTTGFAVAHIDLAWLQQQLERRTVSPGNSLTIVDRGGTILARVPDPQTFVGTKIGSDYLPLLEETTPNSLEVLSQDGTKRILGYFPPAANASGLYVSAGYSLAEGLSTMRTVALQAVGLGLLGTAFASVLAFYTARVFIARPIGVLIDTISAWRNGNTTARTGMSEDNGEIGNAGAALDAFMVEVLLNREARKSADEARDLMRDELEHREKNLLATIQAVARQTFLDSGNRAALRTFSDRLNAISEANRLLRQSGWQSMPLQNLITNAVSTFIGDNLHRVAMTGPDLVVNGNVATALGMSIHELCTNAVKYGALSTDSGRILIEWAVEPAERGGVFTLIWTEEGGPPVTQPGRTGFGSKVIRHALSAQTGGSVEITYDPGGLTCRLTAPAAAVIAQPRAA